MPASPEPYKKKGSDVYYCRLYVPKAGGGYRQVTKSLGTSSLKEARRRFPQAYSSLQEEHKLIEPSPSMLRQKVQKLLDSNVIDPSVDLEDLVLVLTGKRLQEDPDTGKALDPAQEALRDALHHKDPMRIPPGWDELVEAWKERRQRNTGRPPAIRSVDALERAIRELLDASPSPISPLSLSELDVWNYIRNQQSKGVTDSTISGKVSMLRAMTKAAFVQKLVTADPLVHLEFKVAKTEDSGYRSPTQDEYRVIGHNIRENFSRPGDALLCRLLLLTGMRCDEAASRFGQHLSDGMLAVTQLKAPLPQWTAKNPGSYRLVPIPKSIDLPTDTPADQQLFPGCVYRPKDHKFSKAFSVRAARVLFKGLEDAPKGLVIHSFRDGFIDACRSVETPVEIEQALVGHSGAQSKVHKDYGEGYGSDILKKWAYKAEEVLLSYIN